MYSQSELNQINDIVCDDIQLLVDDLGLELYVKDNKLVGPCYIHDSDNEHSFQMYTSGHTRRGNWVCFTNHCQNKFYPNVIGFCRGILSNRSGEEKISFIKTVDYLRHLYGINQLKGETVVDAEKKGGRLLYWLIQYRRKEMAIIYVAGTNI